MNHKLKHITLASAANPTSAVCPTIIRGWEKQKLGLNLKTSFPYLNQDIFHSFKETVRYQQKGIEHEKIAKYHREI